MESSWTYLTQLQAILAGLPTEEIRRAGEILLEARRRGAQVFTLGNGGSAANASHIACDLSKSAIRPDLPRFRVISLVDNVPLATAWANDTSYENVFAAQLENLLHPGDVVIALSGSGRSPNILNAARLARERGATVIGLTGMDGGHLREVTDPCIIVPSDCMEQIEDAHLIIGHLLSIYLRECPIESPVPVATACRHGPNDGNTRVDR
ncbi:MAG: SIS domain-containing protein [Chloroflexia bacterium]